MTVDRRVRPVLLAVGLAIVSVPFVAAMLVQPLPESQQGVGAPVVLLRDAVILALVSTTIAAIVGGGLGGLLVRTHPIAGTLVAIATAWPVAIALLSITASAMRIGLSLAVVCIDSCSTNITEQDAGSGFTAYLRSTATGAALIVPLLAFLGLLGLAVFLRRHDRVVIGLVLGVAAYGALHVWSVIDGGIAYACLAIGVVLWAIVLRRGPAAAKLEPGVAPGT